MVVVLFCYSIVSESYAHIVCFHLKIFHWFGFVCPYLSIFCPINIVPNRYFTFCFLKHEKQFMSVI